MIVSIISALGDNRVIGVKNSLPWSLPADMKHFRELTTGKPVIMGSKTFESIGKPLPNRKNIILSDDPEYKAEGCVIVPSIKEALKEAEGSEEVMIAGGASIYAQFMDRADRMYLTFIHHDFEGDVMFPEYSLEEWEEKSREDHKADDKNPFDYSFVVFERK